MSQSRSQDQAEPQQKPQRERFIEAARELGCDEDEEAFDKALRKIATTPAPPRPQERKPKKKRAK